MRTVHCAYCGKLLTRSDKEHVFPKCLYPPSKAKSKVQRMTVPSCRSCNAGWADDEAHFRNVLALAGKPNSVRSELWNNEILRSFGQIDGRRRVGDVTRQMKLVDTVSGPRYKIYPGEDPRVLRIIRKVIKGLCYYHEILTPVPDHRIYANVLRYVVDPELTKQMIYHHREQDIVDYRYQILNEYEIQSAWIITFFERIPFIGLVSMSEDGFME